jgi:L-ascorbate metabolism protein UlaG (beta-lactamase superfamily)
LKITLIRNAGLVVEYSGVRFLVDPQLDPAGTLPALRDTPDQRRNPLVEVPGWVWPEIRMADVLVLTHLHSDHFDESAKAMVRKSIPVVCLPEQVEQIEGFGFDSVTGVEDSVEFQGVRVTRTKGQHGSGEVREWMAPVCGFVFEAAGEPRLYVAGDTIWCDDVADAISRHAPDVIVVNGGAGRIWVGDPITMTAGDVAKVAVAAPKAAIVVVHLEAIAHCPETRVDLDQGLTELGVRERVAIPADGETMVFEG